MGRRGMTVSLVIILTRRLTNVSANNLDEPGLRVANVGNTDLTWETQITSDVALEFGLFDRIDGTIEVFNKESKDLLFEYELPTSSGVGSIDRNIGKIRNYVSSSSSVLRSCV